MFKALKTGTFASACQSKQYDLIKGEEITNLDARSALRFLKIEAIEKISEKAPVKENKVITPDENKSSDTVDLSKMKKGDLIAFAEANEIEIDESAKKDEILALIESYQD